MKKSLAIFVLLLLSQFAAGQGLRYFPQIGDGGVGSFRFQTSFIFVNTGTDTQFTLAFHGNDGSPLELEVDPLGTGSSFLIDLGTNESLALQTPGTGDLKIGYAKFDASEAVGGTAVFTGSDIPTDTILFEAGVPATGTNESFRVFVDSLGNRNTGIAIVAPEAGGASPAEDSVLETLLLDSSGSEVGTSQITLSPGQKEAKFVYELFPPDSEEREQAREMRGTLVVTSQIGPVAAVTLRQLETSQPFPQEVVTLTTFPVVPQAASSDWQLVWSDEFDGPDIDTTKWDYDTGGSGWGNNELQFYTERPENSRIEQGHLIIQARKETYTAQNRTWSYTSARLQTKNLGDWKYGRFEIRAKLPEGQGIWPAIWMLPTDQVYGTWAASGEIDIVELVGHEPSVLHGTLHYGGQWPRNTSSGSSYTLPSGKFSDDFHVFALEWEEGVIRWYLDGNLIQTQNSWHSNSADSPVDYPAPFDQRFHLLMNVAVGGNWPGRPDETTVFPQELEVDYVRVYQKSE